MEIQSDGKVIFMGTFPITGGGTKSFVRLNVDGTLDNTFTLSLTGNPVDFDLDANDNIVVSGNYLDLDPNPKILKRFDKNGVVDNSFTAGSNFDVPFTGYFVKHISGERMLIGGSFLGYQGTQSPGLVLLDKTGALLPLENPYDSSSNSIKATVDNNTVYMIGRFSRNHGQDFRGVSKMIFPLTTAASNLTAEVSSSSQINLSWTGVPTGADRIVLERSTPDNQHYQPLASLPITQSTYQDKDLKEVTQYYYKLSSANDEYQSPTLEDFDETLIAPQTALPASEITDESFVANWVYVEGTDSCMLQISLNNFVSFVADYENAIVKTGSKSVTGLESGKAYQYRVKRFKNGKSSDFSAPITVNVIVGLENEFQNGVSVFPNPATDRVMIALPVHIGDVDVRIYDSVGKCVDVSLLEAGTTSAIDLDKFQPGVYIITVAMVGQVQKFKLIKRK
jgi:hypothetical protein